VTMAPSDIPAPQIAKIGLVTSAGRRTWRNHVTNSHVSTLLIICRSIAPKALPGKKTLHFRGERTWTKHRAGKATGRKRDQERWPCEPAYVH